MKLIKSFKCAFRGLAYCILNERHMRVHTVIGLFVLLFSRFFCLSSLSYAVLFLTIAAVMSAEIINTAIERLTDFFSPNYSHLAKNIKDISAGAVLTVSIFSVLIAVCVLWDKDAFVRIFCFLSSSVYSIAISLLLLIAAIIYIVLGPKGVLEKFRKNNTN